MSLLNGKVEATHHKEFATYEEASDFIDTLDINSFEGIQVFDNCYRVNYWGNNSKKIIKRELHIMGNGHVCKHPYHRGLLSELRKGNRIGGKYWHMEYYPTIKAYGVHPKGKSQPFYEFTNFNCAASKHHELERAHPGNSFDSMMNN